MADDAAPAGTPPSSSLPTNPHPCLPSAADGHQSPGGLDSLPTFWPAPTLVYCFQYTWGSEVGECCGAGVEQLQGAVDDETAQLLCLACGEMRKVVAHLAEVII